MNTTTPALMNKMMVFKAESLLPVMLVFMLMASCSAPDGNVNEANGVENQIVVSEEVTNDEPISFFTGSYADEWDHFRFAIIEGREFDWDKFVWIEGQSGWDYTYLFEDDFTKSVLAETAYESLSPLWTDDGAKELEFWVVAVDAEGQTVGNVFTFSETSYGLVMTGFRSYE
jgi:hypothetical protein